MKFDYMTEFFLQELEACYFPPERWVSGFPSEFVAYESDEETAAEQLCESRGAE